MQGRYANNEDSRVYYGEERSISYCQCGQRLKVRTSWTDQNPGRRYWDCAYGRSVGGCGFVTWFDPPMCSRSKMIIPGLLRRINRNDQEIEVLKAKIRDISNTNASNSSVKIKLKSLCFVVLIVIVFVTILCLVVGS
nr:uncharacterized protein LOC109193515 [Ipomoea batatas]